MVDVNASGVDAVVHEIGSAGGQARGFAVDLGKRGSIPRLIADVVAHFGGLDILIRTVAR